MVFWKYATYMPRCPGGAPAGLVAFRAALGGGRVATPGSCVLNFYVPGSWGAVRFVRRSRFFYDLEEELGARRP
eukprot:9574360-Alexandrium_andersonii.AAC.1